MVGPFALLRHLGEGEAGTDREDGLGLYGKVGAVAGMVLTLVIFAAQIPLSALWLSRFDFGPAEWVLRSFTYGSLQPLRSSARG